jgi:hypothetical protein
MFSIDGLCTVAPTRFGRGDRDLGAQPGAGLEKVAGRSPF